MAKENVTELLIGGKLYRLSGVENEEYMQQVAIYINSKISVLRDTDGFSRLPQELQSVMLELNLADDFFKQKEQTEDLTVKLEEKERELYQLKHELITLRMAQDAEKQNAAGKNIPEHGVILLDHQHKNNGKRR